MKSIRNLTTILFIVLILAQATLSALTNYATVEIPGFIEKNPEFLILAIVFCLALIIYTTIRIDKESKKGSKTSSTSPNSVGDATAKTSVDINLIPDIFVSYSHHDSDWVNQVLVPKLEKHGFSVLIDSKFIAGRFGLLQIEDGIQYCKHIIAVFTPEYFGSEWTTLENIMAQTLDPATRQRKLIPILLKDSHIPLRLKGIHYRDFRSIDENIWNLLIRDLL